MIREFKGYYYFLSNFYPCKIQYEGLIYMSSEAAFQAAKCKNIKDRIRFINLPPNEAKALGRSIKLREDWEIVKDDIMEDIVRLKFIQNINLMDKLLDTQDKELQEGNTWGDRYWGIDLRSGEGLNKLGKILMKIRNDEYNSIRYQ